MSHNASVAKRDEKKKPDAAAAKKSPDKNMSEIDEHILNRFEIKKRLGKGAYGIVWKAMDRKTKEVVAIKKIFDAFRNQTDAQRTFREIIFLQSFRNHPNIVKLHSIHKFRRTKRSYLMMPMIPLTFITLYSWDLAYGNKLHRIRMEAEHVMSHEAELLELPGGLPSPSSIDLGRLDAEEKKKIHPPLV